ncbi:MAG: hypothetical protein GXP17_03340 [Gammaproteobacteria bacterium]|nr:hypothetical protein [Gammaproteobacteria bacterium]
MFAAASTAFAVDSYRYAHVTIDTPWNIFIFLLFIILTPFILMAILYWYFANKKPDTNKVDEDNA